MPGCGMHSRPNLAEKARYNSLLKIKQTTTTGCGMGRGAQRCSAWEVTRELTRTRGKA